MRKPINIAFNPDTMTVSDLKACAHTLRSLLQKWDQVHGDETISDEEADDIFNSHFLQITDAYTTE